MSVPCRCCGADTINHTLCDKCEQDFYDAIATLFDKHPTGGALRDVFHVGKTDTDTIHWCLDNIAPNYSIEDQRLFVRVAKLLLRIEQPNYRREIIENIYWKRLW